MKKYYIFVAIIFLSTLFLSCHTQKKSTSKPLHTVEKTIPPDNAIIQGVVQQVNSGTHTFTFQVNKIDQRGSSFHAPIQPGQDISVKYTQATLLRGEKYTIEISALEQMGGKYTYTLVRIVK